MSTKDYRALARAIKGEIVNHDGFPAQVAAIHNVAWAVADVCQADNPRFNRAQFLAACGVGS